MAEQETTQSRGIGAFFFAAIPWVLVMAFLGGLGFVSGLFDFHQHVKEVNQSNTLQQRMDNRVGVASPLTSPVQLIIKSDGCLKITEAHLDGINLTTYVHNSCSQHLGYWELHWEIIAPDGTIIGSGYNNTAFLPPLDNGDKTEHVDKLDDDSRTNTVKVWVNSHH